MIEIIEIIEIIIGGTIGLTAAIKWTDEPWYIPCGGVVVACILSLPILIATEILL